MPNNEVENPASDATNGPEAPTQTGGSSGPQASSSNSRENGENLGDRTSLEPRVRSRRVETITEDHPRMQPFREIAACMTPRSAETYMREQLWCENCHEISGIRPMGPRFVCRHLVPDLHYHCRLCQNEVPYQQAPVTGPRNHPSNCGCSDCLFFGPSLYSPE